VGIEQGTCALLVRCTAEGPTVRDALALFGFLSISLSHGTALPRFEGVCLSVRAFVAAISFFEAAWFVTNQAGGIVRRKSSQCWQDR